MGPGPWGKCDTCGEEHWLSRWQSCTRDPKTTADFVGNGMFRQLRTAAKPLPTLGAGVDKAATDSDAALTWKYIFFASGIGFLSYLLIALGTPAMFWPMPFGVAWLIVCGIAWDESAIEGVLVRDLRDQLARTNAELDALRRRHE